MMLDAINFPVKLMNNGESDWSFLLGVQKLLFIMNSAFIINHDQGQKML